MEFPGFSTWAFLNSALVTTILGAAILAGGVGWMGLKLSHRWEMERKRFDFQLQVFRTFEERSRDLASRILSLLGLQKSPEPERTGDAEVDSIQQQIAINETNMAVTQAKIAVNDATLHLTYLYAQIKAAFRDETLLKDFRRVVKDSVIETMEAVAEDGTISNREKHLLRRLCFTETVKIKMIREMGTVPSNECDEIVRYLQDSIELGKFKDLEG